MLILYEAISLNTSAAMEVSQTEPVYGSHDCNYSLTPTTKAISLMSYHTFPICLARNSLSFYGARRIFYYWISSVTCLENELGWLAWEALCCTSELLSYPLSMLLGVSWPTTTCKRFIISIINITKCWETIFMLLSISVYHYCVVLMLNNVQLQYL